MMKVNSLLTGWNRVVLPSTAVEQTPNGAPPARGGEDYPDTLTKPPL
jgi:hypothetical protein